MGERDVGHQAAASAGPSTRQKGRAKATWATSPRPKKVAGRCVVRSTSWSGTTTCSGAYFSLSEPTADTERMECAPSTFSAYTLAR